MEFSHFPQELLPVLAWVGARTKPLSLCRDFCGEEGWECLGIEGWECLGEEPPAAGRGGVLSRTFLCFFPCLLFFPFSIDCIHPSIRKGDSRC